LLINAALAFFERIVRIQHRSYSAERIIDWRQHQQSCQRPMVEPEPRRDSQGLAAPLSLRHRKENSFLDPNMSQQAFSESFISFVPGNAIVGGGLSQQVIEPRMFRPHESIEVSALRASKIGFAVFGRH
jgi:hypothetical protein